jgi:hypothetical protein
VHIVNSYDLFRSPLENRSDCRDAFKGYASPLPFISIWIRLSCQSEKNSSRQSTKRTQQTYQRFFKEKVNAYGITSAASKKIAKKYWKEVCKRDKSDIFLLCEASTSQDTLKRHKLHPSGSPISKNRFEPADIGTFNDGINFLYHELAALMTAFAIIPLCIY